MLALLRAAVLLGAAVWTALAPIPPALRRRCVLLLAAFLAYGILILWLVARWPRRGRAIYLCALVADLAFLYALFRETGGIASPFLPAAFLLAALTAFHYGPGLGVLAACVGLGLAMVSDLNALAERHWSELPLLVIFAVLTAAYVGRLARREAEERRDIERLHDEIQARAYDLEAAYRRCREVQDHLVHSERLATIGRMSAEMAHQVRNPLSAISLNLELLEDDVSRISHRMSAETRKLITAIQKEVDNLAEITESYLRFAKLPPFHMEKASVNEIVRDILVFSKPEIMRRQVKVSQCLQGDLPCVQLDRRQFKFALLNVLSNALEAMSPGGRLRMRTEMNGKGVALMISDTGAGIPKENLERIFEPFFTTKHAGTGLGLPLANRIIQAHGGDMMCESILGVGTTFTLVLPPCGRQLERGANDKECRPCR